MNARSRLPVQVWVSGAASNASISGLVRNPINVWSCFFDGIDKTCWITSDRVGSSNDAYRKNDRTAVRRRLRLRTLLFRFCSRSSKKCADELGIQILQTERGWFFLQLHGRELEQEAKRVPIRRNSVR